VTSYDAFARFYDEAMGDRQREAELVHELIRKHRPDARTVLELACGTGAILERLRPHYDVVGLDVSRPMLDVAAEKLPGVPLFEDDMTRFALGQSFDVVLCVFDSLNHLLRFKEWEAVFDRAREHLADRGMFVFDVNTERKLASFADAPPFARWVADGSLLLIDVVDAGRRVWVWKIRVFEHRGGSEYRLHAEDIAETAFPAERIRASLRKRFAVVRAYDAERSRPTARSERLHFVCRA
jgi:SAM-dependent methyltransferase